VPKIKPRLGRLLRQRRRVREVGYGSGGFAGERLRETEVEHLELPVGPQLDVRGLQVPVDDAALVGLLEGFGDLTGRVEGLVDRQWATPEAFRQILTLHELEDEERPPRGFLETVDGGDPRMVQGGEELRLPPEAGEALGVAADGLGQDLDRYLAAELLVGGAIDLPHPTLAEQCRDPVVGQSAADQDARIYRHPRRAESPGMARPVACVSPADWSPASGSARRCRAGSSASASASGNRRSGSG